MKKLLVILASLLLFQLTFAQKKEKLKGSKNVITQQKIVQPFTQLEILENVEITLVKGDKCAVTLEADDNLQESLNLRNSESMLSISFAKEITAAKKFNIIVTYTNELTSITAKNKSKLTALQTIITPKIKVIAKDNSKLFLNINTPNISISANDRSYLELNCTSENIILDASQQSVIIALITSTDFKCDLYQNANTKIEGDVINMNLRLEGNSNFDGKILNSKTTEISIEENAKCAILGEENIIIKAKDKTSTDIYGNAKIDLQKFEDSAVLKKKNGKIEN